MPEYPILEKINGPRDVKRLSTEERRTLAAELRARIVETVGNRGGHLASNLGSIELTIALHTVFDSPEDKILFDVGHQAYAHKLLTGRFRAFDTLRTRGGISGFPDPRESEHDSFVAGHASNAISAAAGLANARDLQGQHHDIVCVVGDGALGGGMCYEALNDAGQRKTGLIVILNDNTMSISKNVGAMSNYLTTLRQSRGYRAMKRGIRRRLERIPVVGSPLFRVLEKLRDALKMLFVDGAFFEALGFVYIGPIDGHDTEHLIRILRRERHTDKPVLIHVVTKKGKGYVPAESDPISYHGVAPFFCGQKEDKKAGTVSYAKRAATVLSDMADKRDDIVVITAAMTEGTGMTLFREKHKDRLFDVGIAEEHAVTMAGGMASGGMRPYVVLYSTFLARAYDQMLIDICRNHLPVTFLVDHAGFVGADGATHQGVYDVSFLRSMPGIVIACPRDARELEKMIRMSASFDGPLAIRYPKEGTEIVSPTEDDDQLKRLEWQPLSPGKDCTILAYGPSVGLALEVREILAKKGISCAVTNARFLKPLDQKALKSITTPLVVLIGEEEACGGLGEAVAAFFAEAGLSRRLITFDAGDSFIPHASISEQREMCGMTPQKIADSIASRM